MDAIFMNSENSNNSKLHVLILNLTDKIDFRRSEKKGLYQILVFITHGKTKKSSHNDNKFKTSAPTLKDKFELQYGIYLISDIQDYFEHI